MPFQYFSSVYPSIQTHGQPAIFPLTLHFEFLVYVIPLFLSFGICVCLLFCFMVYIQGFCSFSGSLSLSLSLSLALHFCSHRYPDLGCERFKMPVRDLAGKN
jgi:hypothetical protein